MSAAQAEKPEDLPEGSSQVEVRLAGEEKLRVLLVGDSTMATYLGDQPTRGWGQLFPEFFNEQVSFHNAAKGGGSSKSFMDSGDWDEAMEFNPDIVFVQFGHNDQPGKGPPRETDPESTYKEYLRRYIHDAKRAGAEPVLVTSVARRQFENGKMVSTLTPWVDAMIQVGASEEVAVIDLHRSSIALFEEAGEEAGADLNNGLPDDISHFSEKGARAVAGLVIADLPEKAPQLAAFLKE